MFVHEEAFALTDVSRHVGKFGHELICFLLTQIFEKTETNVKSCAIIANKIKYMFFVLDMLFL